MTPIQDRIDEMEHRHDAINQWLMAGNRLPGVPCRKEVYEMLKEHSKAIQAGEVDDE